MIQVRLKVLKLRKELEELPNMKSRLLVQGKLNVGNTDILDAIIKVTRAYL